MIQRLLSLPLLITLLFCFTFSAQGQTSQEVFNQGVALFKQENYVEALEKFELVLRANPRFVHARSYINQCKLKIANNAGPKNDLEGTLTKIVLPSVALKEVPIGDVLEFFAVRAEELTGGKFVPNFIYKGTPDQRENTLITLNLRNVPMSEAIRYVGQLSRTQIRYEQHAIVVDPNYGRSSTSSSVQTPAVQANPPGTVFGEPVKNVFDN